jgi:V/A-type H+-transporting ATPase subunit E
MQNKLQELTEKIYQEGITRANEEAEKIISGARAESEKIIKEAEKEAKKIVSEAEKKAEETMKNTGSELKLSFRHALNALKQEIEKVITCKIVEDPVSEAFTDNRFIARLIEITAEKWSPGNDEKGIEIYLPEEILNEIEKYLTGKTHKTLSEGITLQPVKSMEKGFEIHPHGKEYKISVTESDFASYIKEFLRPKLVDLLFDNTK